MTLDHAQRQYDTMEPHEPRERDTSELWDACRESQCDAIHASFQESDAMTDLIGGIEEARYSDAELGRLLRRKFNEHKVEKLERMEADGVVAATGTYGL